jgi:ABC-type sugar transport system ATPase subunit
VPRSPWHAVELGIGLIPEDRKTQGAILPLSVGSNFTFANLRALTNRLGLIKRSEEKLVVQKLATNLLPQ